ncbi:hypothetical protein PoB_005013300 [Plakobranchus ocellatus]|uniref:Uncharacterized protein n=1 Tax=Plakobranchus ocellatus TaxID=259542 RepID=A0AAV4BWP1_9GAST|nr:hypothetical protein PoB_005013300 [Plakobranchus ocellatus]
MFSSHQFHLALMVTQRIAGSAWKPARCLPNRVSRRELVKSLEQQSRQLALLQMVKPIPSTAGVSYQTNRRVISVTDHWGNHERKPAGPITISFIGQRK